jgi:hypothetical protein
MESALFPRLCAAANLGGLSTQGGVTDLRGSATPAHTTPGLRAGGR